MPMSCSRCAATTRSSASSTSARAPSTGTRAARRSPAACAGSSSTGSWTKAGLDHHRFACRELSGRSMPDDPAHLIVDGNNVMGAAADGWWRDRAGAARRLLGRVQCYAAATGASIELVFDVALPDVGEGLHDGVVVRYAPRSGRDAADDRIRDLLDSHAPAARKGLIEVVTSD